MSAAAAYLRDHPEMLPSDLAPVTTTQRTVTAVEIYEVLLGHDSESGTFRVIAKPDPAAVFSAAQALHPMYKP